MTEPAPGSREAISVIICTYTEERWDDLVAAVDSIRGQTVPADEIVVVVDYNPAMLARVRRELPGVVAVPNAGAKGLSGGKNTGVAVSTAALLAFLDDDATAAPDWLELLTRHFVDPRVLGAGSSVVARWAAGRPRWFPSEFDWVVGCTYRGAPQTVTVARNVWGGAMCVRRELFESVGGFRTGIGRVDRKPLGCEDTEWCIRAGQRWPERFFLLDPAARIYHHVPAARNRWSYFRARCLAEGYSKALVARLVGRQPALSSERSYTRTILPKGITRGLADALAGRDPAGLARSGAIVAGLCLTAAGYARGLRLREQRT